MTGIKTFKWYNTGEFSTCKCGGVMEGLEVRPTRALVYNISVYMCQDCKKLQHKEPLGFKEIVEEPDSGKGVNPGTADRSVPE